MYNGTGASIGANIIVRVEPTGLQGGALKMDVARATTDPLGGKVPLFVTKHAVPAGKWGVVLPWVILQNVNTAATAAGLPVFLQDADTGAWGVTGGATVKRVVGIVLFSNAATGSLLLCPGMFTYGTI